MKSQSVSFRSYDGTLLRGTLTAGSPGKRQPWVLLVHGITSDRHEWGFYDELVKALAALDIPSLTFDFRCHGKSKTLPAEQMTLTGIIEDIDAAVRFLREGWGLQPGMLSIVGRSFGGGVATLWAERNRRWVHHLFLCSPVLQYEHDIRKTAGDWTERIAKGQLVQYVPGYMIGAALISEIPSIDRQISLKGWKGQATIFHGTADTDVPFIESETRRGEAELIALDGAEHNMGAPGDDDLVDPMTRRHHHAIIALILRRVSC